MTATTTDRPTAGTLRRGVFIASSVLLAAMTLLLLLPNVAPPLVTDWGGPHFIHDIAFTLFGVMVLAGLVAQIGAPRRRVGAMLVTLAFPAVFVIVGMPAGRFVFEPPIIMLVLAVIATASHPASRDLLRPIASREPITLGLAAVWVVPALVYALGQFELQRGAPVADPHAEFGHWVGMGVVALLVALLAGVAGLRPAGWSVAAGLAVASAVLVGAASAGFPNLASSFGVGGGVAALVWGLALATVSVVTGPRDAAVGQPAPARQGRPLRIRAQTTIDRPIHEVFAVVSDPRNDPQWCGYVKAVEQTAGDGPAVGARYRALHDPRPGKAVPLEVEIRELDPPRRMVLFEEDFAAQLLVTCELDALDDRRTRITQTTEARLKGVWKLMAPASYLGIRATLPKQFAALKAHLESSVQQPSR